MTLKVYDIIGREISTFVKGELQAGDYSIQWNAGSSPSGAYFYRLESGNYAETKKLVLVR